MPSKGNLEIYQGDDYAAIVTVTGGTTPPDLSGGYVAQAQIRTGPADTNPQVVVEIVTAIVLPNYIALSIPASQTICLSGEYVWDLQLIWPDGSLHTLMAGRVTVTLEVTRMAVNGTGARRTARGGAR